MSDPILLIIVITAPVSGWAFGCAAWHAWREAHHPPKKERRP